MVQRGLEQLAHHNFGLWNQALLSGQPKRVAGLYHLKATLHPTLMGEIKKGPKEIEEYFEHFLTKSPQSEIVEEEIVGLGSDCYLHLGIYRFYLKTAKQKEVVLARFTFVWQKNQKGEWKILHHHSSLMP